MAADVDGDDDLDIVCGNSAQDRLYLNDGNAVFTDGPASLTTYPWLTRSMAIGDIDNDETSTSFAVALAMLDFSPTKEPASLPIGPHRDFRRRQRLTGSADEIEVGITIPIAITTAAAFAPSTGSKCLLRSASSIPAGAWEGRATASAAATPV